MTDCVVKRFASPDRKERSPGVDCDREGARKSRRCYEGTDHAADSQLLDGLFSSVIPPW